MIIELHIQDTPPQPPLHKEHSWVVTRGLTQEVAISGASVAEIESTLHELLFLRNHSEHYTVLWPISKSRSN